MARLVEPDKRELALLSESQVPCNYWSLEGIFSHKQFCNAEVLLAMLALLLLYLQANNNKKNSTAKQQDIKTRHTINPVQSKVKTCTNKWVYKAQSKHTKTKSRHRTGTILLRNVSLCLHIESKSGGRRMEYRWDCFWLKSAKSNSPIGPIQPGWDLGHTKPSQNIHKSSHAIVLVWFYWGM